MRNPPKTRILKIRSWRRRSIAVGFILGMATLLLVHVMVFVFRSVH